MSRDVGIGVATVAASKVVSEARLDSVATRRPLGVWYAGLRGGEDGGMVSQS